MNKIIIMGRCVKNPIFKETQNVDIASLTLALDEFKDGEKSPLYLDVVLFGKQAQSADKWLKKGYRAQVEGKLTIDKWKDKETGEDRQKPKIIAERLYLIDFKKQDEDENIEVEYKDKSGKTVKKERIKKSEDSTRDIDIDDEEIPF